MDDSHTAAHSNSKEEKDEDASPTQSANLQASANRSGSFNAADASGAWKTRMDGGVEENSRNVATHEPHPSSQASRSLLPSRNNPQRSQQSSVARVTEFRPPHDQQLMRASHSLLPRASTKDSHVNQSPNAALEADCESNTSAFTPSPLMYQPDDGTTYFIYPDTSAAFQMPVTQFPLSMMGTTAMTTQMQALGLPAGYFANFPAGQRPPFFPGQISGAVAPTLQQLPGQQHPTPPYSASNVAGGGKTASYAAMLGRLAGSTYFQAPTPNLAHIYAGSYAPNIAALAHLSRQYPMFGQTHAQSLGHYTGMVLPLSPFENMNLPCTPQEPQLGGTTAWRTHHTSQATLVNPAGLQSHNERQSVRQREFFRRLPYFQPGRIVPEQERNIAVQAWLENCERSLAGGTWETSAPPSIGGSTNIASGTSTTSREPTRQAERDCPQKQPASFQHRRLPASRNENTELPESCIPLQAAISRLQPISLLPRDCQKRQQSKGNRGGQGVGQQLPRSKPRGAKQRAAANVPPPVSRRRGWSTWEDTHQAPQQSICHPRKEVAITSHVALRTPGGVLKGAENNEKDVKDSLKSSGAVTTTIYMPVGELPLDLRTRPAAKGEIKQETSAADHSAEHHHHEAKNSKNGASRQANTHCRNTECDEPQVGPVAVCTRTDVATERKETELEKNMSELEARVLEMVTHLTDEQNAPSDDNSVVADNRYEIIDKDVALHYRLFGGPHHFGQPRRSPEKDKSEAMSSPEIPRSSSPEMFYALFQGSPNSPEKCLVELQDDWSLCTSRNCWVTSTDTLFLLKERLSPPKEMLTPSDEVFTLLELEPSQSP